LTPIVVDGESTKEIKHTLKRRREILVAYLYGLTAKGCQDKKSDVDVCTLQKILKEINQGKMSAIKMKWASRFRIVEKSVVKDKNFLYTIVSYSVTLAIFMNLNSFQSPLIGLIASILYFVINAVFLGNAFLAKENAFFRLMFGVLLLIMLLGVVGWLVLIYNLDVTRFTLVLLITTTFSSLLNRRMNKHASY
jgi:hypothetical protein